MRAGNNGGVAIESVAPGSPAAKAGVEAGDVLRSINGRRVDDVIDYMFQRGEPEMDLALSRRGRRLSVKLSPSEGEETGLGLAHFKVRTCRNKCIFCFVSQLPRGLRRTLYVRDEDYRMSFLYGNYVTLTSLSAEDRKRIARQRLSPLYISIHATDRAVRNRMLGNPKAQDIMKDLRFLKEHRIRMHTQIVLCPGINDGAVLEKTVRDLHSLYPYVASIAVVPVGLTAHGRRKTAPVSKEDAERALDAIEASQKKFRRKHGEPLIHASDELYIRAGRPFPPLEDFGDLPQIENGVGMVPFFVSRARRMKLDVGPSKRRFLTFTGVSFYPYLKKFIERLQKRGVKIDLLPVENTFFGASVTVTGLLTGRDVIKSLSVASGDSPRREAAGRHDVLLVPDVALKEGKVFLDDVSVADVEAALGVKARVIEATPEGLLKGLEDEN